MEYGDYMRARDEAIANKGASSRDGASRMRAWLQAVPRIDSSIESNRKLAIARMPDLVIGATEIDRYGVPQKIGDIKFFGGRDPTRLRSLGWIATASEAVALGLMPPEFVFCSEDIYALAVNPTPLIERRMRFFNDARTIANQIRTPLAASTRSKIENGQAVCNYDLIDVEIEGETKFVPIWLAIGLQHLPETTRRISTMLFGMER